MLPFDNLSDKQQGYLADGITEDLTTELARLPGLFVVSRNAAFTYKDKAMQPTQVAIFSVIAKSFLFDFNSTRSIRTRVK